MCALSVFLRSQTNKSMRLNVVRDLVKQLTGQRVPCFDSCQWIATLMSNMCALSVFLCSRARKYEIEHWSRSSKAINWSADSFQKSTSRRWVDTWDRDMVMWYWSVAILFWQLSIDHFVNVQYTRCGLAKTRLRHPSLPFDSLPYPTLAICRCVLTLGQSRDNQMKRGWPYFMSMGLCPTRAWEPCYKLVFLAFFKSNGSMSNVVYFTKLQPDNS